jgi:hypothetical protein
MKINAKNYKSTTKYLSGILDKNHFTALIFTRWTSRRLPPAALLKAQRAIAGKI